MTTSPLLTTIPVERYAVQRARWPKTGRHVLAHFDESTVIVYQAYRPSIARWAVDHRRLGGPEFGLGRMSWIKPNFLWMMYRSGWATKENQEAVLAVRITRAGFEELLAHAVPSSFVPELYADPEVWQAAVRRSDVRLQWDPDHHPSGAPCERRAIQLGLRGDVLARYVAEWTVAIEDMTPFVAAQRANASNALGDLVTPLERVFVPADPETARRLGLDAETGSE